MRRPAILCSLLAILHSRCHPTAWAQGCPWQLAWISSWLWQHRFASAIPGVYRPNERMPAHQASCPCDMMPMHATLAFAFPCVDTLPHMHPCHLASKLLTLQVSLSSKVMREVVWSCGKRNKCLRRHCRNANTHYHLYVCRLLLLCQGIEPNLGLQKSSRRAAADNITVTDSQCSISQYKKCSTYHTI